MRYENDAASPHAAARLTVCNRLRSVSGSLVFAALCAIPLGAQRSTGPAAGTLIVDGGGATEPIVRRFVETAGGKAARIVVVPTGPSAIRFGEQNTILDPDWPRGRKEWIQYEAYLKTWFGADQIQIIHTRDRGVADADSFVAPLRSATGVYLPAGNSGRYATRTSGRERSPNYALYSAAEV